MFYDLQPQEAKEDYKETLALVGSLSRLFSMSDKPMLNYRAHENIFCECFKAENCARQDISIDAKMHTLGIGLKTWVDNNNRDDQKVAEFGLLRETYQGLDDFKLVKTIAEYRNKRIQTTKNLHRLDNLIYHVVKRVHYGMNIYESVFDEINVPSIELLKKKGTKNNVYFKDGKHVYHFSKSKNTLYMIFDDLRFLDYVDVKILENPIDALKTLDFSQFEQKTYNPFDVSNSVCLRLYSVKNGKKYVPEKSGLNQWNAAGRKRHPDEIYIPYPKADQVKRLDFFPPRDHPFVLHLPGGIEISAKVCQDGNKAIMSNPNKVLGKWLLRDVLELPENTLITYEMLEGFGIDSVVFTKINNDEYSVDFTELGTYEKWNELSDAGIG